ncbi:MAG: hypothetical protein IPH53_10905 [Flavobacteriales bacterium]|nr:hypothetical protein [Flavobacteriales bacterium]MBK7085138.1 hypothetical protein [Flavobacteriales bacterium]MBK9076650.1 hypothetical protein [Flavobacteriales bacterium]MBK9538066.1 hypothetical protein [Flavobacteriales bacterium]
MILRLAALLFLLSTLCVNAQDPVGFFIEKSDTVWMYESRSSQSGTCSMTAQLLRYHVKEDKRERQVSQSKVSELNFGGRKWINMSIASLGMDRLHELIMESDKYILTSYWDGFSFMYIIDKDAGKYVVKKEMHSWREAKDREMFKAIKKYFPECTEALAAMEKGLEEGYATENYSSMDHEADRMFKYVKNYRCPGR